MLDRRSFFSAIRTPLFDGRLSVSQTSGLSAILDRWEARQTWTDLRWLAYMLATAHHETARTMLPIHERGGPSYLTRMYDITGSRPALARRNGNTAPGDGVRYAGRGYVQLTWKDNYRRAGDRLGVDLVGDPDLALEPGIAADIMFLGMAEGWFTGRKLADYFDGARSDWLNARRIVNQLDKAAEIRAHALAYDAALRAASSPAVQPRARSASRASKPSAKAQGPSATNSAPVAARGATAAASGA